MKQLKINNQFVTQKRISQGSFGIVMQGLDQKNGNQVAIKIERPENEHLRSLDKEVEILQRLQNVKGVPQLLFYGYEEHYNVIVLELLHKDLASLIKHRKKLSLKSVLQLSIELVQIFEGVHGQGVLHRDLKPDNMMLDEKNKVYLIDYGISKIFLKKNGILVPFKDKVPFVGTSRYASISAHKGFELGRKDDLESLLVHASIDNQVSNLPWQNLKNVPDEQRTQKIGEMKDSIDLRELFKDMPHEFIKIYDYLRKLTYAAEPDYKTIVKLLQQATKHANILLDYKYDWDEQDKNNINRYGTLQPEEVPMKNFEKFQSNLNLQGCNNVIAQTPSRSKLQLPILKLESNSNSNNGSGNGNYSFYNSMGIIYQISADEISEELQESIPNEQKSQISIHLQQLPDYLKKPTQFNEEIIETNPLSDKYKSLSAQATTIFHKK